MCCFALTRQQWVTASCTIICSHCSPTLGSVAMGVCRPTMKQACMKKLPKVGTTADPVRSKVHLRVRQKARLGKVADNQVPGQHCRPSQRAHIRARQNQHATLLLVSSFSWPIPFFLIIIFCFVIFTTVVLVYKHSWNAPDKHISVHSCNWWRQLKCTLNSRHLQSAFESIEWFMCLNSGTCFITWLNHGRKAIHLTLGLFCFRNSMINFLPLLFVCKM